MAPGAGEGVLLDVRGITKRFGGLVANNDVSLRVSAGELVGVIGPNGAGKSTLFDLLTGFQTADAGEVLLDGRAVTRLRPDEISRLGVARTFQKLKPFTQMTVLENVMVGAFQKTSDPARARREALEALERVGLADKADAHAREFEQVAPSGNEQAIVGKGRIGDWFHEWNRARDRRSVCA